MTPTRLRAVPDENGEIPKTLVELKDEIARKDAEIRGLTRDLRGWMVRYRQLEEDKALEAREHGLYGLGTHLFNCWRRACDHPRSQWSEDRFWLLEQFLVLPRYAPTLEPRVILCCRAIMGARYDCWKTVRRNGTTKRFDEWQRIFASSGSFEEFVSRCPKGWAPTITPLLADLIVQGEVYLERRKEAAKLDRKRVD